VLAAPSASSSTPSGDGGASGASEDGMGETIVVNGRVLPKPSEGEAIPGAREGGVTTPDNSIRTVWTSPFERHLVFDHPGDEARLEQLHDDISDIEANLPDRAGSYDLALLLNRSARWFPPPILWLVIGVVAMSAPVVGLSWSGWVPPHHMAHAYFIARRSPSSTALSSIGESAWAWEGSRSVMPQSRSANAAARIRSSIRSKPRRPFARLGSDRGCPASFPAFPLAARPVSRACRWYPSCGWTRGLQRTVRASAMCANQGGVVMAGYRYVSLVVVTVLALAAGGRVGAAPSALARKR